MIGPTGAAGLDGALVAPSIAAPGPLFVQTTSSVERPADAAWPV